MNFNIGCFNTSHVTINLKGITVSIKGNSFNTSHVTINLYQRPENYMQ